MLKKSLLFLLFAFAFSACSNLETIKETDDAGNIIAKYSQDKENKTREGLYKAFDADGTLVEEANYKDNRLDGERKIYYPNGQVEAIEQYKNGAYQGNFLGYYETGELKIAGNYINNAMQGEWKRYYANKQTQELVLFKDNEENGPFVEYYDNGNIKAEGTYKNGDNEHGELKIYDKAGELEKIMDCTMGRCKKRWQKEENTKNETDSFNN